MTYCGLSTAKQSATACSSPTASICLGLPLNLESSPCSLFSPRRVAAVAGEGVGLLLLLSAAIVGRKKSVSLCSGRITQRAMATPSSLLRSVLRVSVTDGLCDLE